MNGLLLYSFNTKLLKLLVENLTQVHNNRLVDFLPKMGSEYLNQGYLESWDFAVHENTGQIQLNLETNVHIGAVYRRCIGVSRLLA